VERPAEAAASAGSKKNQKQIKERRVEEKTNDERTVRTSLPKGFQFDGAVPGIARLSL
jgi:hypothetical protein